MSLKVKILDLNGFDDARVPKLGTALRMLRLVFSSSFFRDEVLNRTPSFYTRNNMTNDAIYRWIVRAEEVDINKLSQVMELNLNLDARFNKEEVGYTSRVDGSIWTYRNQFDALTQFDLCGHYGHEYCHLLGFSDPQDTAAMVRNVPYGIQNIVSSLALKYQGKEHELLQADVV